VPQKGHDRTLSRLFWFFINHLTSIRLSYYTVVKKQNPKWLLSNIHSNKQSININVCPLNAATESFLLCNWHTGICCVLTVWLQGLEENSGLSFCSVDTKLIFQSLDDSTVLHWTAFINCCYYVSHCLETISISGRTTLITQHSLCAVWGGLFRCFWLSIRIENQMEYKFRSKLNGVNSSFCPTEVPLGPHYDVYSINPQFQNFQY
jgi:hypothetical protein